MPEVTGKDCLLKISGAALTLTGEPTTSIAGNMVYQITDAAKQVLDRTATILVLRKGTNDAAEAGTTTTNLKMTAHGLATSDIIINTSRSNAKRSVVRVDADNVTVTAVTGQTTSDVIEVYKADPVGDYTLNRLNGKITYTAATVRVILISGSYLPMTTAAGANKLSESRKAAMHEITKFQSDYVQRKAGLKSASGTIENIDLTDLTYSNALTAGEPIVIEWRETSASEPNRFWAILDKRELTSALNAITNEAVSWMSFDAWIRLGV